MYKLKECILLFDSPLLLPSGVTVSGGSPDKCDLWLCSGPVEVGLDPDCCLLGLLGAAPLLSVAQLTGHLWRDLQGTGESPVK